MADEPKRHRIELTCPECGHRQLEPAMVVSTQCRSCRTNFQVIDSKAVSRPKAATRIAKVRPENSPSPELPVPKTSPFSKPTAPAPKPGLLRRLLFRPQPPHEVACFNCGHVHKAVAE